MYIMKPIYAIALLLAGITLTASAQDSGTLPVLSQNPDALSAAMGQTGGSTLSGGHYIYSAPGAVFDRSERFSLSYTGVIGTGHDSMWSGSGFYNAVTGSWRFRDKHAVIAGFRYLGGGSVLTSTESGDGREIHPMDITADLGYALRINNHWRAYVVGHFVESYIGKIALTGGGSLGATYAAGSPLYPSGTPSEPLSVISVERSSTARRVASTPCPAPSPSPVTCAMGSPRSGRCSLR